MGNISYIAFREQFVKYGCFSCSQVALWHKSFDINNFTRWCKQGLLIRLRKGWYAFPECLAKPDFARYIAGRIYKPSYISLHTALAFYGMIPEAVVSINSVTTLKTASFSSQFGDYAYQHIKPSLLFGFELKPMDDGRAIPFATPEKALLDLMYLYPMYDTPDDLLNLRLDEDFLHEDLDMERLNEYLKAFNNKALADRVKILKTVYEL
ncbi:MAG: hypothetical protein HUK14_09860 [Muribaculaceae bacterium]|nr:hypothetical protein [Muribaculaceae bacterium]